MYSNNSLCLLSDLKCWFLLICTWHVFSIFMKWLLTLYWQYKVLLRTYCRLSYFLNCPKSSRSEGCVQYGLWSFQMEGINLKLFLPKNLHTQGKLLNFVNWVNGEVSKCAKIWLSKSIFYVKNYPNISHFFFHWRISI